MALFDSKWVFLIVISREGKAYLVIRLIRELWLFIAARIEAGLEWTKWSKAANDGKNKSKESECSRDIILSKLSLSPPIDIFNFILYHLFELVVVSFADPIDKDAEGKSPNNEDDWHEVGEEGSHHVREHFWLLVLS